MILSFFWGGGKTSNNNPCMITLWYNKKVTIFTNKEGELPWH